MNGVLGIKLMNGVLDWAGLYYGQFATGANEIYFGMNHAPIAG